MTDKTPQNKAKNSVNTPTTLAGKTDTARHSEPKSRALPQADTLKQRFKAGSIPLQTDFADLIDLADMGRKAVGGTEGQKGPADGFTVSSIGRLELKPNAAKGISVDQDGLAIKLKTISGLTMDTDGVSVKPKADSGIELKDSAGISIKPGNGISVDKDGIAVKAEGNKGLQVNNNGVSVKTGNGIAVTSDGVNIKLAKGTNTNGGEGHGTDGATSGMGGGLNLTSNGLSVDAGKGIQIDQQGVSLKLATNSGLSADETNGVKVMAGSGIKISNGAVTIDQENVLPRGIITMFSGSQSPEGWAFCNGSNGTPDLRDRFIKGSSTISTGTGTGGRKSIVYTPTGNVTVDPHVLTIEEMPKHNHKFTGTDKYESGFYLATMQVGPLNTPDSYSQSISEVGGNKAHAHTASFNGESSTIDIEPQYYALAFIMKL